MGLNYAWERWEARPGATSHGGAVICYEAETAEGRRASRVWAVSQEEMIRNGVFWDRTLWAILAMMRAEMDELCDVKRERWVPWTWTPTRDATPRPGHR